MAATSISTDSPPSHLKGMALAAAAFALLSLSDVVFKLLAGAGHPPAQILLVNAIFALLPILGWSHLSGGLRQLGTSRVPLHLARGAASVASALLAIYAYSRLSLTAFYAILFAGPLIVTALSALWLGETIGVKRGLAICCGLAGIMVVVNPFAPHTGPVSGVDLAAGRFAAFLSVFCYALSVVMVRRMRRRETNLSFSFYGYSAAVAISFVMFMLQPAPLPFTMRDIGLLALSGTAAGSSSICLMTAYHRTPVALVAPFQYSQIIWGALAGYLLWAQLPSLHLLLGAAIVALSGFTIVLSEIKGRRKTDR